MKEEKYILVIGSLNYDILFRQARLPYEGETFTADDISFCSGGKGANQAVQCAKLGAKTIMIGKTGNDLFGKVLTDSLNKYGVDISYLKKSEKTTGLASVNVLDKGIVHATIATGANFDITIEDIDEIETLIADCSIVIIQMEIPMNVNEHIIEIASKYNKYIVLNAAPAKPIRKDILKLVDCLVVNETEASYYAETKIDSPESAILNYKLLLDKIKSTLIITLGKNGEVLCNSEMVKHIDAIDCGKAVESTGAGDSFIGGFAYGKLYGMSDMEACMIAGKTSGYTVTKVGAQEAMPTIEEIDCL